jgi:hypothetical protein
MVYVPAPRLPIQYLPLLSVLALWLTPAAFLMVTVAPASGLLDPSATVPLTDAMLSAALSCGSIAPIHAPSAVRIPTTPALARAAAALLPTQMDININPQKTTLGNLTIPLRLRATSLLGFLVLRFLGTRDAPLSHAQLAGVSHCGQTRLNRQISRNFQFQRGIRRSHCSPCTATTARP